MKFAKTLVIIIGAVLFIWFFLPLFAGILNAGNIIGMLFCACVLCYGIFMRGIHRGIKKFWKRLSGKIVLTVAALITAAAVVFVTVATVNIIYTANRRPTEPTTVVVLGCKVNPNGPSLLLRYRLDAALDFLNQNPDVKCVLSGGQGADEPMSEAQAMYNWLVQRGIDPTRLYIEDRSTSTRENLQFSKELIASEGLTQKVTIITNDFHQYRAGRIAADLGIVCRHVSGKTHILLLPTYYVRELGGVLYEIFMG